MLTVHCGILPWNLNEFEYPEYKKCIKELAIKLNFDGIVNVLGNSYAQDAGEIVNSANPFNHSEKQQNKKQRMTKEMALQFMGQK
ncbi:hypothetical protein G9F71_008260 [Clostridium sp. FP2]|uniref:hypothetical protein n=1 Tax=Clostridium sp. FP2 TaxID=2724481 RepID=UPI0013E971A8|nr:hypothetical protein [Clostridium sp. FP2]MBZ9622844.1 hypothetical protein [Clostridium sp. FP2]